MINFRLRDLCTDFQCGVVARMAGNKRHRRFRVRHDLRCKHASLSRDSSRLRPSRRSDGSQWCRSSRKRSFVDGVSFELSSNQYPDNVIREGYQFLMTFRLDPFPIWVYEVAGVEVEKKIFMVHGQNTVVCKWSMRRTDRRDKRPISLSVRPLLSFVDYHHLRHQDAGVLVEYDQEERRRLDATSRGRRRSFFQHDASRIEKTGYWYRDFEYAIEHERGFDFREDLFQPFAMTFDNVIGDGDRVDGFGVNRAAAKLEKAELKQRAALVKRAEAKDEFSKAAIARCGSVRRYSRHRAIRSSPVIRGFPIGAATR